MVTAMVSAAISWWGRWWSLHGQLAQALGSHRRAQLQCPGLQALKLVLCWNIGRSNYDSALEELVLLKGSNQVNLLKLSIIGHGGATCPSWLSIKCLESLCLDGVAC